jgi:GT2 family glycosyltransferase
LTGLEDLDWSKKILSLDYKIAYISDAEVVHVHNESFKKIYNRYYREALAFKEIFPDEIFRLRDFVKFTISNTVTDYYHAWHDRVFLKNLFAIPIFRFMQFWGTYKGFLKHGIITSEVKQTFYYPRKMEKPKESKQSYEDRIIEYKLTKEDYLEKIL